MVNGVWIGEGSVKGLGVLVDGREDGVLVGETAVGWHPIKNNIRSIHKILYCLVPKCIRANCNHIFPNFVTI